MRKRTISIILVLAMTLAITPSMMTTAEAYDMGKAGYTQNISVGSGHVLYVRSDGSLFVWGSNGDGELGDGTTIDSDIPFQIMSDVATASAGIGFSVALKNDGSLWSWGFNDGGQLGDGTTASRSTPLKIMEGVASISAGSSHSLAIKTDGSLWAWGENYFGEIGDGTRDDCLSPKKIMNDVKAASASPSNSWAIKDDGSLWGWGGDYYGHLFGSNSIFNNVPKKIMDNVIAVSSAGSACFVIKGDGSLWGWGHNGNGLLGDGTTTHRSAPVKIMDNVVTISSGTSACFAIKSDKTLWGWGFNSGSLGDGTTMDRSTPVKIMDNVMAVSSGVSSETVAITEDGSLWAWGRSSSGRLSSHWLPKNTTPVKVTFHENLGLDNFVKTKVYDHNKFKDVPEDSWYAQNVATAYELGLMNGNSTTTFNPTGNITIAETITLAARLHNIYHMGSESFVMGSPWYQTYVDYARQNGIISEADINYNKAATRAEFATILSKSMPYEALQVINNIADNSIPDVPNSENYSSYVYKLYRAGILTGNDNLGTFKPDTTIGRHEASAIVARMAMTSLRKTFSLGEMLGSISLYPSTLTIDTQIPRYVKVEYSSGDGSGETITWSSSNPRVASVEDGWVNGILPGKAVITAKTSTGQTASCNVTVVSKVNMTIAGVYSNIRDLIEDCTLSLSKAYDDVQYNSRLWSARGYMSVVESGAELIKYYCEQNTHTSAKAIVKELDNLSKNASAAQDMIQILESKGEGNYSWTDYTNAVDYILAAQNNLIAFTKAFPSKSVDTTMNNDVQYYSGTSVPTFECIIGADCKYTYFLSVSTVKEGHQNYGDLYEYAYNADDLDNYIDAVKALGWYLFDTSQVEGGTLYAFQKEGKMFGVYSKPYSGVIWVGNFT